MDKEVLSALLSEKLGKRIKIKEMILVGSGYHSNGYKVITESGEIYFLKQIKSHDLGFEFPERKVSSLLVSHSMANRTDLHPKSFGVILHNEKMEFLPVLNEDTRIYQIQEYGGEGKSYLKILEEKKDKKEIDQKDREEIKKIVDYISKVHSIKHPSKDEARLKAIYNDNLRNVIGHQEYMLMLFHSIPSENPLLPPKKQGEFLSLMLENMHYLKDRIERLRALHGDFWGANVFFKDDGNIFVIDYSRMPWGEPGFDIGFWISQYILNYYKHNNKYFIELGRLFLEKYVQKTGDKEISNNSIYSLGLISVMYSSQTWVPGIADKVRKEFYDYVVQMLKSKKFSWPI